MKTHHFQLSLIFICCLMSIQIWAQSTIEIEGSNSDADGNVSTPISKIDNHNYSKYMAVTFSDTHFRNPQLQFVRSRGTRSSPENLHSGDRTGGIYSHMYLNGILRGAPLASIEFYIDSKPNENSFGSFINFSTTSPDHESREERMRIDELGNLGIGTADPQTKVHVRNGDVYLEDIGAGIIMRSQNGGCWRLSVEDDGDPKFNAIPCPGQ